MSKESVAGRDEEGEVVSRREFLKGMFGAAVLGTIGRKSFAGEVMNKENPIFDLEVQRSVLGSIAEKGCIILHTNSSIIFNTTILT